MQPRINDPMRMVDKRGLPTQLAKPAAENPLKAARRAVREDMMQGRQEQAAEMPRSDGGIAPRTPGGRNVNKTYNTYI